MSEIYTPFEQQFGVGDVVKWRGYRYIVREVYDDEQGFYYYIEEASDESLDDMPFAAEVPQEDLKEA